MLPHRAIITSLCVACCFPAIFAAEPRQMSSPVFQAGIGYPNYRIPSLVAHPSGALIAIAEGRTNDDPGEPNSNLDLVSRRSLDGGLTWQPMQVIDAWAGGTSSNATSVVDRTTGRVYLLYNRWEGNYGANSQPGTNNNTAWVRYSDDEGQTWSNPSDITANVKDYNNWNTTAFGPGSGIQASNGRLLIPASRYVAGPGNAPYAVYSNDHGLTWTRGTLLTGGNLASENQFVQLADGKILMDARQTSASDGPRVNSLSSNGGLSWSAATEGQIAPSVEAAIERFSLVSAGNDKNRLLWTGPTGPGRIDLVVRASYDENQSWTNQRLLWDGYSGYSDISILPDRNIGVLFETEEARSIRFTKFNRQLIEPPKNLKGYDGFRYNTATMSSQNGGLLWSSGWAGQINLTGTPTARVEGVDLSYTNFPFAIESQKRILFDNGGVMVRALPASIDLGSDQTYYLSLLVRQKDVGTDTESSFEGMDVQLYSGTTKIGAFGVTGAEAFYVDLPGAGATGETNALFKDNTYYLVAKVVAKSSGVAGDQIFLKAYKSGDAVLATDDGFGWTLAATAGSNGSAIIDRIAFKGGSLSDWMLDEFRYGTSFGAVVSNRLQYVWNVDAASTWADDANWVDAYPDEPGVNAVFAGAISAARTINVAANVTVGTLTFNNLQPYTLSGAGSISFSGVNGTGIDVISGGHTVAVPLLATGTLNIQTAPGTTLSILSPLTGGTVSALNKTGAGNVEAKSVNIGSLSVVAGKISLLADGGTSRVKILTISDGATLDLRNNDFIIDYDGASVSGVLRTLIASGFAGGSWDGDGLTSSSAGGVLAIGYAEAGSLGTTSFSGQTVDATSLLLRLTNLGDANLDRIVDSSDFNRFVAGYGSIDARWDTGDFNYDGKVDTADFNLLAGSFGSSASLPVGTVVPEPSIFGVALFSTLFLRNRRSGRMHSRHGR